MEKIVVWSIGVVLALVLILFIRAQLGSSSGGLMTKFISAVFGIGS